MMKPIGGYFELELNKGNEYHSDSLHLNTGRNCLEYILRAKGYKTIYIPHYMCEVLLEPIKKLKINYKFYHIDSNLDPLFNKHLKKHEALLYINYFGIKQRAIFLLNEKVENLIVDNAHAFFDKPPGNADAFYSVRKFFGVSDGAYLYTNKFLEQSFKQDISFNRIQHLVKRIDLGAEAGYCDFKINDVSLINQPIMQMSRLTEALLCNIDYAKAQASRKNNFLFLHEKLQALNKLKIDTAILKAPMVYPLLSNILGLREELLEQKVFVATYWPNVLKDMDADEVEYQIAKNIIPLPIDQRYGKTELERIIKLIVSCKS